MRKPDLYVVARFLDALDARPEGRTKSDLQRAARVNYDLFRKYVDLLVAQSLAARIGKGRNERIRLTDKGAKARTRLRAWIQDALGMLPG